MQIQFRRQCTYIRLIHSETGGARETVKKGVGGTNFYTNFEFIELINK